MTAADPAEESGFRASRPGIDRVRPFVLVGGRTRSHQHLLVETLVTSVGEQGAAERLSPEAGVVHRATRTMTSVAELSSMVGLPLGVVRVLLTDLAAADLVIIHPTGFEFNNDMAMLERVRDGLLRLRA